MHRLQHRQQDVMLLQHPFELRRTPRAPAIFGYKVSEDEDGESRGRELRRTPGGCDGRQGHQLGPGSKSARKDGRTDGRTHQLGPGSKSVYAGSKRLTSSSHLP